MFQDSLSPALHICRLSGFHPNPFRSALAILFVSLACLMDGGLFARDKVNCSVLCVVVQDLETVQIKPAASNDGASNVPKSEDLQPEFVDLVTDDLNSHWKQFSSVTIPAETPVWKTVRDDDGKELVLVCSGEPKGYLHSIQSYSDFELTLEWKYPKDIDGNSGVLVFTQVEPRIWPTSMQVQLHQPKAGSVFPSGDAMSDHSSEAEPGLARPVNTWNECRIVSQGGRLTVEVNGTKAGEVSGSKPNSGRIALQSEGSVVHFRRIRIRDLAPAKTTKIIPASPETPKPAEAGVPGPRG